ncbi:hypothetical protein FKM82_022121 [Ascaphus truei]
MGTRGVICCCKTGTKAVSKNDTGFKGENPVAFNGNHFLDTYAAILVLQPWDLYEGQMVLIWGKKHTLPFMFCPRIAPLLP